MYMFPRQSRNRKECPARCYSVSGTTLIRSCDEPHVSVLPTLPRKIVSVAQVTNTFVFVFEVDMAAPEPAARAEAEQGELLSDRASLRPRTLKRVLPTSPEEAELICEILADD